jgi:uncharacterized protein (DUF1697 family)
VTTWVALLRGVNVGGNRPVPMADLRSALEVSGATGVRTYLQSGNAVLAGPSSEEAVARLVRDAVSALGVKCDVVVRSAAELAHVVAANPWPERVGEPTKINVGFLSAAGDGGVRGASAAEEVLFRGREAYLWYGDGQGRSKLALDVGERVLTVRNWRTVTALAELSGAT